jgi:hypothetical protein
MVQFVQMIFFPSMQELSQVQSQLWHQISQMIDKLVTLTRLTKGPLYMYQASATNNSKMKLVLHMPGC